MRTNNTFFDFVKVGGLSVVVFLLFAPGAFAFGVTAQVTPATLTESNQAFIFSADCQSNTTGNLDIVIFNPNGIPLSGVGLNCASVTTSFSLNYVLSDWDFWISEPGIFGTYTIIADDLDNPCITQWDGMTSELTGCIAQYGALGTFTFSADSTGFTFSLIKPGEPGLLTTAGTPMIASVQETGANIWPLFVLLGVVLAFAIALQVVVFSKRAVGAPEKTSKKRAGGKNSIPADVDPRDYRAYRRGKKLIQKDFPDFYKN
jgi:hypothetical protein